MKTINQTQITKKINKKIKLFKYPKIIFGIFNVFKKNKLTKSRAKKQKKDRKIFSTRLKIITNPTRK